MQPKHAVLTRKSRTLSSSDQISATPGLFNAPFGWGVFAEAAQVTVVMDDGTSVVLQDAIEDVVAMWAEYHRAGWPAP